MAKKIRFPLKLAEGAEVRTLEELREHFDLQAILEYYTNGKLLTWLNDRYLEGEAEAIRALKPSAVHFQRRLCEVFQVAYTGSDMDLEEIERRQERLKRLRQVTDEVEYIQNIDRVAFEQEDLADLLDEGETKIYLCGERFTVPASREGITYVGIKNPTVHVSGKIAKSFDQLKIKFIGVSFDNQNCIGTVGATFSKQTISLLESLSKMSSSKVMSANYFLIRRPGKKEPEDEFDDSDDVFDDAEDEFDDDWYICEIRTGKEIPVSEEIQRAFAHIEQSSFFHGINKKEFKHLIFKDKICFCWYSYNYKSGGLIIDLSLNKVVYSWANFHYQKVVAFDDEFIIFFSDPDYTDEKSLQFYDYHKRNYHKPSKKINLSNCSNKIYSFALGNKALYFVANQAMIMGGLKIARLDLTNSIRALESPQFFTEVSFIPHKMIVRDNYIYLWNTTCFCIVNLSVGSTQQLVSPSNTNNFLMATGYSEQYIAYINKSKKHLHSLDGYKGEEANLFAIELASGKVKKLPFFFNTENSFLLFLQGATLYCSNYDNKAGKCISAEFDLTEDFPKPIEFKF